jgi:hypothetical protein
MGLDSREPAGIQAFKAFVSSQNIDRRIAHGQQTAVVFHPANGNTREGKIIRVILQGNCPLRVDGDAALPEGDVLRDDLGSPYVVVIAVRYRVSEVWFSTVASLSKRLTMKSTGSGSQAEGSASSNCMPPQHRIGHVKSARRRSSL